MNFTVSSILLYSASVASLYSMRSTASRNVTAGCRILSKDNACFKEVTLSVPSRPSKRTLVRPWRWSKSNIKSMSSSSLLKTSSRRA